MNNGNKQTNIEKIRSLIAKLELTNRRVKRCLHKMNRIISNEELNATIIAKARIIHQGEGLRGTTLHIGDQDTIVNLNPVQQHSSVIKGTTST